MPDVYRGLWVLTRFDPCPCLLNHHADLASKLRFSSTGGRSLTMIFSHGFGLRFDLLYALSMVCAAWQCFLFRAQQIVPSWSFMFCQLIIPFCVVRFHLCTRETMCLCCNVKFHSVAQVLFGLFNIITAIFVEATLPLDSTIGVAGLNSHITC